MPPITGMGSFCCWIWRGTRFTGDDGASLSNIVKVTSFVTDLREAPASADVRRKYIAGEFPASTQVQVAALGTPDLKIEIEAIAVLPA